jgi:hypothetical protein
MRGQTSLEIALVAVIVIIAGLASYMIYSEESFHSSAEATIRSQADLALTKGRLMHPECAGAQLAPITLSVSGKERTYLLSVEGPVAVACTQLVFDSDTVMHINRMVNIALNCPQDGCRGYDYIVKAA